jgi:hypothetical protein
MIKRFANEAEKNSILKENLKVVTICPKFERELGDSGKFQGAGFEARCRK